MFSTRLNLCCIVLTISVVLATVNTNQPRKARRMKSIMLQDVNAQPAIAAQPNQSFKDGVVCAENQKRIDGECRDYRFKCSKIIRHESELIDCLACTVPYWPKKDDKGDHYCENRWDYYVWITVGIISTVFLILGLIWLGCFLVRKYCKDRSSSYYFFGGSGPNRMDLEDANLIGY